MRGRRNEADVAMAFAAARVVGLDDEQPGVLALRAGIGLQRHRRIAGRGAEHALEVGDDLAVAAGLIRRRERVQVAELGPRHRDHLRRRVELHRARPERNHRAVERDVAVREPAQVAQHLRFRVVAVERRMREERRRPRSNASGSASGDAREQSRRAPRPRASPPNACQIASTSARVDVSSSDKPERARVDPAEIHPLRHAAVENRLRGVAGRDHDRVEEVCRRHGVAEPREARLQDRGQPMHAPRDRRQAGGAVVDRVHRPRSPRAAPAPCRCSTSPSRGGCAARASAARDGRPGRRSRRR